MSLNSPQATMSLWSKVDCNKIDFEWCLNFYFN